MIDERFYLKPKYSESWAIIIGINDYATMPPLTFAVNDAQEFAITLRDRYNFQEKNIISLLDKDATYKNICDSFCKIADQANIDDRVVFYFAGHGHTISGIKGDVGFLIPHDATDNIASYIPWTYFTNNSDLIHAKHILFIIDACYGGLALTRNVGSGSSRFVKDMLQRLSRQVVTSGKADEVVADGGGPLADHSIFTGHLLEGLAGKAGTGQGIITGNSLMAFEKSKLDMSIQPSVDEIINRLSIYEDLVLNLSLTASCISYWGDERQLLLLQKIISRFSDALYVKNGYQLWVHLNIFPLVLFIYYCGISATYGERYDSILKIFNSTYHNIDNDRRDCIIRQIAYGISGINTNEIFKKIPNYKNLYVPMNEYIYALLQPKIDNLFFLGTLYESVFDEFEILLSLLIADYFDQNGEYVFGPIGRFGWKEKRCNAPLSAMIQKAENEKSKWKPLKAGLFGGDISRFMKVAKHIQTRIMESSYFF